MITKDNFSSIITDNTIVVNYSGETHMISRSDAYSEKVLQAIKSGRLNDIPDLINVAKRLEKASDGLFTIKNGEVYVEGVVAPHVLGRKIEDFANEGLPYGPLVRFAKRLQANPSFRAVTELYQFLEKNNHPVTEDGCFIAYKKVGDDFKDLYTRTMDNSPGQTVEMPRNKVNEDPNQTCSWGLHVANWDYAANKYGFASQPMLEVKVDPADVVAVPTDYNQAKMRVCKYVVLGVVKEEVSTPLRVVDPTYNNDVDDGEADCGENCMAHSTCRDDGTPQEILCADCDDYHYADDECLSTEEYCEECLEYFDSDDGHDCVEVEEEDEYCVDCDEYYDANTVHDCPEEEDDDEEDYCEECGSYYYVDYGHRCAMEEEEEDDADDYPWDDEIDE